MLASIPMPLPPLLEQKRIVKLLDEADELRELRTQADRRTSSLIPRSLPRNVRRPGAYSLSSEATH